MAFIGTFKGTLKENFDRIMNPRKFLNEKGDITNKIISYENGDMSDEEVLEFFSELIKSKIIKGLQGSYQRTARDLVDGGYLSNSGDILKDIQSESVNKIKKISETVEPIDPDDQDVIDMNIVKSGNKLVENYNRIQLLNEKMLNEWGPGQDIIGVSNMFVQGKPKKLGNYQSTGDAMYYHGNKVAEWKEGSLYISNGDYAGQGGETGSKTTMALLNTLPGVRISQKNYKWILNGTEWDGSWIKVDGVAAPQVDKGSGQLKGFILKKKYVKTDGWRGYERPIYAVVGANDTGMWEDSPARSDTAEKELNGVKNALKKEGIETKLVTSESGNVFMVRHFLVPKVEDFDRAKVIVDNYIDGNHTELLYSIDEE